ncbi:Maff2 family protein, partial [Dysosmobacter welbionis]
MCEIVDVWRLRRSERKNQEKGLGKNPGFSQLICLRQIKQIESFSPRRVRGENALTQPPFEAHRISLSVRLCR